MFVIYIIVAVVITFLFTLIKVTIDEWFRNSSMEKQGRLSLKRIKCETHTTSEKYNMPDMSDDESFDLKKENSANLGNKETVNRLSNIADPLNVACNLECVHDISDDLSTSEDVITIEDTPEKRKLQTSMFNWYHKPKHVSKKPSTSRYWKEGASHELGFNKEIPEETSYKKQKFTNEVINVDDDDDATSISSKEEDSPPQVTIQHDIMIAGTKIKFPAKPYPCQIAVINSLIQGCNKEQNCLLESPTGSGKTLALLCGVLAWQDQYEEKLSRERKQNNEMDVDKSCCNDSSNSVENFFLNSSQYLDECVDKMSDFLKEKLPQKVPKVYYGTRTHKQLEQVVREFRKTAYRHKRMTILSSRDHTCLQETHRNKTELCNELLDPHKFKSCPYYNERSKRDMHVFTRLPTPWDIEDLVKMGEENTVCPYFGARSLMPDSEIIFCPYNYIVNPEIRESMQINLRGDIVILDEAHNIEDICREVASVNITNDDLANAITDCENVLETLKKNPKKTVHDEDYVAHMIIWEYLGDMAKFLKNIAVKENGNSQDLVSDCWRGSEFLELFNINNVGRSRFPALLNASKLAIANFEKAREEVIKPYVLPTISRETKKILEHLCFAMQMIMSDSAANDYRAYVVESMEPRKTIPDDVWISTKTKLRIMKFMCMNPGVIFAPLAKIVRSVILASGTLAPISSFQSELGTQFPHVLNANHIIPKDQVYVRCLPCGPSGKSLIATYENVNFWTFQDELGDLILQVCNAVPYGVLCFFSSYNVMSKLHDRWEHNGMLRKLLELKQIFKEPRDNRDLPRTMKNYRDVIKESSLKPYRVTSGAILFAVFRGKVAEGIDFSDNEARCVLTVGIPYSNRNNVDVSMKIAYNDANGTKGLLSGKDWYTVNAFRALNQGLGRCIRHVKDWGAVLLVDERLQRSQNVNYLPKWIKERRKQSVNYDLQTELEDFVALQAARERAENE